MFCVKGLSLLLQLQLFKKTPFRIKLSLTDPVLSNTTLFRVSLTDCRQMLRKKKQLTQAAFISNSLRFCGLQYLPKHRLYIHRRSLRGVLRLETTLGEYICQPLIIILKWRRLGKCMGNESKASYGKTAFFKPAHLCIIKVINF